MDDDRLPDFLEINGFGARPGMFAAARRRPGAGDPFSALTSPPTSSFVQALNPLIGSAGQGSSIFRHSPFPPAMPDATCPLVPLDPAPGTVAANGSDLRFSPTFVGIVRKATDTLNQQGIPLDVSSGFRTAADQLRMRQGGSGRNPAARYSDHGLGNGIDINGTALPTFPAIIQAFKQAGAQWGGDYRGKKDRPHFYIRPVRANATNTAECERENPR